MASTTKDTTTTTPVRVATVDPEMTYAPKRAKRDGAVGCLSTINPPLRYKWPLADGRIGGYIFDKEEEERSVKLYTLDTPGTRFTDAMQHISYNTEEWMMSKNNSGKTWVYQDRMVSTLSGRLKYYSRWASLKTAAMRLK